MKRAVLSLMIISSLVGLPSTGGTKDVGVYLISSISYAAECKDGVQIGVPISGEDDCVGSKDENPIWEYIRGVIKFASSIFGLLVILMIIVSGIQYITSQGNPEQYKNAKSRLTQAVTGLILFILMFGILNYLIPGGILK